MMGHSKSKKHMDEFVAYCPSCCSLTRPSFHPCVFTEVAQAELDWGLHPTAFDIAVQKSKCASRLYVGSCLENPSCQLKATNLRFSETLVKKLS